MNQETKHLIDFIKNKADNIANLGIVKFWECLNALAAEVEKRELYYKIDGLCDNLKELFIEKDYNALLNVIKSRDYFLIYGGLFYLLSEYLNDADNKSWLSCIRTNDEKEQATIVDYMSMRFNLNKEANNEI